MEREQIRWAPLLSFEVYRIDEVNLLTDRAGVYMFVKREWMPATQNHLAGWQSTPLYVGKTGDFTERLSNHQKWEPAARLGMTDIHFLNTTDPADRTRIEGAIYDRLHPIGHLPLNDIAPPGSKDAILRPPGITPSRPPGVPPLPATFHLPVPLPGDFSPKK
ncbi:MAG: hypothetical protein OYL41_10955 [Acidobacteriota bacterium]|nr:hypothetical protein [Acidobacteriota bacterium]